MSRIVQLISNDGRSFSVPEDICAVSTHISDTLSMSDQDETNPTLDLMHINGVHLEIFVEFMHMYAANPILTPIAKPIDYSALPKYATDLLSKLKMVTADMKDLRNTEVSLMSLMYGANMLQIDVLKQLLTGKLIDTIKDVNLRQMNVLFGLPEDHVPKHSDLRDIQEKYKYVLYPSA